MAYDYPRTTQRITSLQSGTGVFTWVIAPRRSVKAGDIAGSVFTAGSSSKMYRRIGLLTKKYKSHRLAWLYVYGQFPDNEIDHIDGDGTNNRIDNLRDVRRKENGKNRRLRTDSTSGFTGVCYDKARRKWAANIKVDGTQIYLGRFESKTEAIDARTIANKTYGFHENHGHDRPL
jgi:hypothetical protein